MKIWLAILVGVALSSNSYGQGVRVNGEGVKKQIESSSDEYNASMSNTEKSTEAVTLQFSENSSILTEDLKSQIRSLVSTAPKRGEGKSIGIAGWSDEEFPGPKRELSKKQRNLAQARIDAVENYIESLKFKGEINTYNMAESSNWLARTFSTEESELKSMFSKKDLSEDVLKPRYRHFMKEGEPQKVVIVMTAK